MKTKFRQFNLTKLRLLFMTLTLTTGNPILGQLVYSGYEQEPTTEQMEQLESFMAYHLTNRENRSTSDLYIVPVVVHIIHNNGIENVSDETVQNTIAYLNQQFKGLLGGYDCGIEFRLARIDPNGNCTTGITRTVTPTPSIAYNSSLTGSGIYWEDHVPASSIQNLIRWPTSKYLNIYIVKSIKLKVQVGFQTFQYQNAGWCAWKPSLIPVSETNDGIFIQYSCLGANGVINGTGPLVNLNTKGMLAHCAGASLGLENVWGNGWIVNGCCRNDESTYNSGDYIDDTPACNYYVSGWSNVVSQMSTCADLWNCNNASQCYVIPGGTPIPNPTSPFPKDNFMSWNFSCQNKFTNGQALWMKDKIDLHRPVLCTYANLAATGVLNSIPTSTTWNPSNFANGNVYIGQNLIVPNGSVLTINAGVTVHFASNARFIIQPGGRVVLNGGKLTAQCGNYWPGVEVWGQANMPQTYLNQGSLAILNQGTIEKAECAIYIGGRHILIPSMYVPSRNGGFVEANNAVLKNNKQDVNVKPYNNYTIVSGIQFPAKNITRFNDCDFIVDAVLPSVSQLPFRVTMSFVDGIKFNACHFRVTGGALSGYSISNRGGAIEALSAGFVAKSRCLVGFPVNSECEPGILTASNIGLPGSNVKPTIFENYYQAVRVVGGYSLNPVVINSCFFKNNQFGLYMSTTYNASIYRNRFLVKEQGALVAYGASLLECTGYQVERNVFEAEGPLTVLNTGIWISQSAKTSNEIYLNDFNNLAIGTMAQGEQVDEQHDYEGLEMLCGKYNNCKYNIGVQRYGNSMGKIALRQGKFAPNAQAVTYPAGNLFTQTNWGATLPHTDYYICPDGDCDPIGYEHHNILSSWPVTPIYKDPHMVLNVDNLPYFTTRDAACPIGDIPKVKSNLQNKVVQSRLEIAEKTNEIEQLVDGGITPHWLSFIQDASNTSATVRASILPMAPYISNKVQRELIMRSPHLNPWHLCELLIACSPLKPEIMALVDEQNQLPEYLYNLLLSYQNGRNDYTYKEMALKGVKMDKAMALRDYYHASIGEDELQYGLEDIKTMLEEEEGKYATRHKIDILRLEHNYTEAQNLLAAYEEDSDKEVWKLYMEVMLAIETTGDYTDSTGIHISALEEMAASGKEGCHHAAALLEILTGIQPIEELNLPIELRSLKPSKLRPATAQRPSITEVYPNPAVGEFYITYVLPAERKSAQIRIFDLQGKLIQTEDITRGFGILDLNANSFSSGSYVYDLILNGEKVESGKFNVYH